MSKVEMGQTQADHPGADRDPSDQKRTGAKTARRDESETENRDGAHEDSRERTAGGAWCSKHGAKTPRWGSRREP